MSELNSVRPRPTTPGALLLTVAARVRGAAAALVSEPAIVLALMVAGVVAHGLNMFNYPAFTLTDDEGIFAAQGWAVLRHAQLSPYTYVYDAPPAGQILLAIWSRLTGGVSTFGGAVDGGRALMLLLHLAMIPLLFRLVRRLGGGVSAAALAAFLFSVSPLAVFYQRLLLPDTIMLFWLLLSLDLLLDGWGRLSRVVLSGVCFGVAVLSRETAIVFAPALLFIAFQQRWQHQGRFAVTGWAVPALVVLSWYPLFALLKGELFPDVALGQAPVDGYATGGISLIEALWSQLTRGGGGAFNLDNQFWGFVRGDWLRRDPLLLAGGAAATAINLLRGIRLRRLGNRHALAAGLLGLLPLLYLARGGLVLSSDILLVIPFLALNLAILAAAVLNRLPAPAAGALGATAAALLVAGYWSSGVMQPLYEARPDEPGREALAWIKHNLPPDARIIARDDLWTDLREQTPDGPPLANAHSHWKVAGDPAVRTSVFQDDWRRVDYVILEPGMREDLEAANNTVALQALDNAHLVKRWTPAASGRADLHPEQAIELWKVDAPGATETTLLADAAASIDARFNRGGAYTDAAGKVTSEAQSYALLRAVWSGDRAAFDEAWAWTRGHLLRPDGTLSWLWQNGRVTDANSATDADVDTALALLLAGRRWNDPALTEAGRAMARAVWQTDVVTVAGTPYLTAGNWAKDGPVVALNPSYFAPYAFRIFHEVDPAHDWRALIDTGYGVLFNASAAPLGEPRSSGLPPDWVGLDRSTGALVPLRFDDGDTTAYGYDAARTYWRIALDARWSGDGRATTYLGLAGFLRDEATRKGYVGGVYGHGGAVLQDTPTPTGDAGAIAALLTLDPPTAHQLHAARIVGGAVRTATGVHWSDPDDLYGQEWSWFSTALYAGAIPDLWRAP